MSTTDFRRVASLADLHRTGRKTIRDGNKQIALFAVGDRVLACNNRCPHEGYPLSEGTMGPDCVLTCNWHNWKFDLESGETLVGGDALRRYPVRIDGDDVLLDLADPPAAETVAKALDGLADSFDRHEYDRMAREIARIARAGGDVREAAREAIRRRHDHFEFGTSHAFAAAPDWLALAETVPEDPVRQVAAMTEIAGHIAWDTRFSPTYPYPEGSQAWSADAFVAAIRAEDETTAVRKLRGALAQGLGFADVAPAFYRAALAHYQDFGHALIYSVKAGELIGKLGDGIAEPLLLALTRSLVYATREDLIPEFRAYRPALENWVSGDGPAPAPEDLRRESVTGVLKRLSTSGGQPEAIYDSLLEAAAWQMLHFDIALQGRTDAPVGGNVNWLDFTHAITFANAVRIACRSCPDLWPAGLLQIGCFLGRNSGHLDTEQDTARWQVADPAGFYDGKLESLFDHAQPEYIVSAHLVKLLTAAKVETGARPGRPWEPVLAASVNRFLGEPLKRKHVLRTARQAIGFVSREG